MRPDADDCRPVAGLWTPWAEALCFDCHGPEAKDGRWTLTDEQLSYYRQPRYPADDCEGLCTCDKCGREIVVRSEVAWLSRVREEARARGLLAELQQTGGMCAALEVRRPGEDGAIWFVSAMDGYLCCRYPNAEAVYEGEYDDIIFDEEWGEGDPQPASVVDAIARDKWVL